ncbi:MAG: SMC-Scp complex subunit ScpB [Geminicoccaceae bacterium]|nr:SMC-Scp complex subunit ScpB [Geminicoccaceae bacterium]MCB9969336.1 SMC-Scp complex subunit ScpB [Geminicoccaceae bacterium]HRY23642.1 SMC-Scp complex subunit ScpB [Geminicoccaceae bacterium]
MSDEGEAIDAKLVVEALLFQSREPLDEALLQAHVRDGRHVLAILEELAADYAARGVRLERHGRQWAFRTAASVAPHLERVESRRRRLSKAAMETLAIIAYQQPVTRAEIEAVRGVPVARGTLDQLVEAGWVRPKGRREVPGRPVTWVTTPGFLDQFDLSSLDDLPRLDELEAAGLFRTAGGGGSAPDDATAEAHGQADIELPPGVAGT